MLSHFKHYNKTDILSLMRLRRFETKIGECVQCGTGTCSIEETISQAKAGFIVLGIPEDIGVMANLGRGGADSCWFPFLDSFLNSQSNDFFSGENVLIAGHFDFAEVKRLININAVSDDEKLEAYRH